MDNSDTTYHTPISYKLGEHLPLSMPITASVGNKNIFAIEWTILGTYSVSTQDYRRVGTDILADVTFWTKDNMFAEGGVQFENAIWYVEKYYRKYLWQVAIDFSDIPKENVWEIIEKGFNGGFPEKYYDFYVQCKKIMLEQCQTGKMNTGDNYYEKKSLEKSIILGYQFTDDDFFANWFGGFDITNVCADAFSSNIDSMRIFIVPDYKYKQARLLWEYNAEFKYDENDNLIQSGQVYESKIPIDYFDEVIVEFAEVASKQVKEIMELCSYPEKME